MTQNCTKWIERRKFEFYTYLSIIASTNSVAALKNTKNGLVVIRKLLIKSKVALCINCIIVFFTILSQNKTGQKCSIV